MDNIIELIKIEVQRGLHDSTQGLRPEVIIDRDGNVALSYPAGPDWLSWETKIA